MSKYESQGNQWPDPSYRGNQRQERRGKGQPRSPRSTRTSSKHAGADDNNAADNYNNNYSNDADNYNKNYSNNVYSNDGIAPYNSNDYNNMNGDAPTNHWLPDPTRSPVIIRTNEVNVFTGDGGGQQNKRGGFFRQTLAAIGHYVDRQLGTNHD